MTDFYKQQSVSTTGAPGTLCERVCVRNRPVRNDKDEVTVDLRADYGWSGVTFNDPGAEFLSLVCLPDVSNEETQCSCSSKLHR